MAYKNPSLIEVYAEFHCKAGSVSQGNLFDVVPEFKKSGLIDVEVSQIPGIAISHNGQPIPVNAPRIRCWDTDKSNLAQLSPDLIVFNQVGKYQGWDNFRDFATKSWKSVMEHIPTAVLDSINLVAKDLISVPNATYSSEKYLNCDGSVIPKWYQSKNSSFDVVLGSGILQIDGFNSQVKVSVRTNQQDETQIYLETYEQEKLKTTPQELLEALHIKLNNQFEAMINDVTRTEILGGKL